MEADGAGEQMRPLLTRVTSRVRAAGDGPPRLGGGGAERDRQRRGRGMRRGPATTSGARRPSTAPRPVRLAIPFVWLPRARVRGGGRPRRGGGPTGGGRQRATRASSPRASSAPLGRDPGTSAGPVLPPLTPTISSFLSAALVTLFPGVLPGRGLSSGGLSAGVHISPSKTHLSSPNKEEHGSTCQLPQSVVKSWGESFPFFPVSPPGSRCALFGEFFGRVDEPPSFEAKASF